MSLKTDYLNGSTGLQAVLDAAFTAGQTYVSTNNGTLSTALVSAASQGQTNFQVIVLGTGSLSAAALRANNANNLLLKAFFAGIQDGLAVQNVYNFECSLQLNVSDQVATNVNFNFTFQYA